MAELTEVSSGGGIFEPEDVGRVYEEMERFPEIYLNLVAEISGKVVGWI